MKCRICTTHPILACNIVVVLDGGGYYETGMKPDYDDIPETALRWHREGRGAILATVVETWGSAPRPVGAQMAISGASDFVGSVSGGCVEGAIVAEALDALAAGSAQLATYGISDEDAFSVGLPCGGTIKVLIEPVGRGLGADILSQLCDLRAERLAVAYVVDLEQSVRRLARPGDETPPGAIDARFASDRSGYEGGAFVTVHNPPLRLAVVGAVHIAQPLVVMARLAAFDVTLIDPRDGFATAERFPGEPIVTDWPDHALQAMGLDARTAVVTLAHDPKLDDPAILAALGSDVFYIGCLGSKRTHEKRVARLVAAGCSAEQISRIYAPVGLMIGAKSPAEIAISIMAEMTQRVRRK